MSENEIQPIKLKNVNNNNSMNSNINDSKREQSIVIESDNSSRNDILKDDKTKTQNEIDELIEKLQDDKHFEDINDGKNFKNISENKEHAFYKLKILLKNQDNQNYFLSLCEDGKNITFTLFSRVLQECSFVKEYIKLNNALVLKYHDHNNTGNYNLYNKVIIFNKNNIKNKSLQNIFKKINYIEIINHARNNYAWTIGAHRKFNTLERSTELQVFTYNSPSNWFYPTIGCSEQRATDQAKLLSEIINCAQENNNKTSLSMQNFCSGNYFGFDLLTRALESIKNKEKICIRNIQMQNIIENGLFHMGAEDIARKFIELITNFSKKAGIFEDTTISFRHKDDFLHKNGCKQFADALTTILNSDKDKYKDVIDIIKKIHFKNMRLIIPSKQKYFDDQLNYFKQKLKEITNDEPDQNIETIHNVRKTEDKACCCCFGCNNN